MSMTHMVIPIYIVLYPINVIFYIIIILDEVYNINSLDNQNELKTRPKMVG